MKKREHQSGGAQAQSQTDSLIDQPVIRSITHLFLEAGHELYLVGGSVRDALLGRSHDDYDFATDAPPEKTVSLVRGYADDIWQVGIDFGTIGFIKAGCRLEVTTYRKEIYPEGSRHPQVTFAPTIESDLSRRDFTVNSMAIKLPTGELIDPFGGLSDLASGQLVTPTGAEQSFMDDPLRMLRALRFVSSLNMSLSPDVTDAILKLGSNLEIVSRERIRDELSKLLTSPSPVAAIIAMVETGIAAHVVPELMDIALLRDPANRHKDVLKHTLMVVDNVPADLTLRLAALFHDVGKPKTMTSGPDGIHFFHHEVVGAKMARRRLRKLRFPVKLIAEVTELIEFHMRFHTYRLGWTDKAVRKYVREVGPERLVQLDKLVRADCTTQNDAL